MEVESNKIKKTFKEREINIDDLSINNEDYELVKGKKLKVILDNLYNLFFKETDTDTKEEEELIKLLFGLKYHIEKDRQEVLKFMITNGYSFEMVTKVVEIFVNYL